MEVKKTKLSCSFCGKQQSKVKKLIAGPNIYICNECVDLGNDILGGDDSRDLSSRAALLATITSWSRAWLSSQRQTDSEDPLRKRRFREGVQTKP